MDSKFLDRVRDTGSGISFLPYMKDGVWHERTADEFYSNPPEGEYDLYFSVLTFKTSSRKRENALPNMWLWADLDEVNPADIELKPTIAWESSKGRYQCLWQLEHGASAETLEQASRALTYKVGADKGGWSRTKVLRVPGTMNYKYDPPQQVKLLWDNGPLYMIADVWQFTGQIDENNNHVEPVNDEIPTPDENYDQLYEIAWDLLDPRGRRLLSAKEAWGDRSARLWELECRLLETGLSKENVFLIAKQSVWNKHADKPNGDEVLWQEIAKASLSVSTMNTSASNNASEVDTEPIYRKVKPTLVTYGDLLGSQIAEPQWLIQDWWTMGSHGIIAGLPKSYKSLVTTDMALSVATGTPFMNMYEVNEKGIGPTLVVQVENSPALLKDRVVKMAYNKGLLHGASHIDDGTLSVTFPTQVPMFFYNDFAFDMTDEACRQAIETIIVQEGIRMVVFDPLYLMMGSVDENSAHEIRPILSWLLQLRNYYNIAVIVVHHWGKGSSDRKGRKQGGVKLLGSTTIYGWLESALYLEASPNTDGSSTVVVEREFRERLAPPPQAFKLRMGDIGEIDYAWEGEGVVGTEANIFNLLTQKPMSMTELQAASGMGEKKTRALLTKLLADGAITMEQEGKSKVFRLAK